MTEDMAMTSDVRILRELAKRVKAAAESQDRERLKRLWRKLHDREMERPMIYIWVILFTEELEEITALQCTHPLFRQKEKELRTELYHYYTGDDYLIEPYIVLQASHTGLEHGHWGMQFPSRPSPGGAADMFPDPPIKSLDDLSLLRPAQHCVDEERTAANRKMLEDAVGDIMPVHLARTPVLYQAPMASMAMFLRGMTQIMLDMVENPSKLHRLLRIMKQIGGDYIISWRPNPTDHVCATFDRDRIRRQIAQGRDILAKHGCQYEINLKDVLTVRGDRELLREWVKIVRSVTE